MNQTALSRVTTPEGMVPDELQARSTRSRQDKVGPYLANTQNLVAATMPFDPLTRTQEEQWRALPSDVREQLWPRGTERLEWWAREYGAVVLRPEALTTARTTNAGTFDLHNVRLDAASHTTAMFDGITNSRRTRDVSESQKYSHGQQHRDPVKTDLEVLAFLGNLPHNIQEAVQRVVHPLPETFLSQYYYENWPASSGFAFLRIWCHIVTDSVVMFLTAARTAPDSLVDPFAASPQPWNATIRAARTTKSRVRSSLRTSRQRSP